MNAMLLGLAVLLGAPNPKDKPDKDTGIVGAWIAESTTLNGKRQKPLDKGEVRYEFTADGKQIIRRVGAEPKSPPSEYKVDATASPATIDIVIPRSGRDGYKLLGIYKIEGDTLTIVTRADGVRPTKFEANDGAREMMMTFKRATKKD